MRIIPAFIVCINSDSDPRDGDGRDLPILKLKDAALIEGFDIILDEGTRDRIAADYVYDRKSFDALPVATEDIL